MKVFITGNKEKVLDNNTIYAKQAMIAGDRPYYLDIGGNENGCYSFKFVYHQNEHKIIEWSNPDLNVKFGPETGRIYLVATTKPLNRISIAQKLSFIHKELTKRLKNHDLRSVTNFDFGIRMIRKSLEVEQIFE